MGIAKDAFTFSDLTMVYSDTVPVNIGRITIGRGDTISGSLQPEIDSLRKLQIPSPSEARLIDSLKKASPIQEIRQADRKVKEVEQVLMQKANRLNSDLTKSVEQLGLSTTLIPKEITNGTKLQAIPGVPNLPAAGLNIPGNPIGQTNALTSAPKKEIIVLEKQAGVGNLKQDMAQANGYSRDLKQISNGNLDSTQLLKTAEVKANQLVKSELKQMPQQSGQLGQVTKMGEAMQDPKAAQQLAADQLKKQAVDHFAGKEKELQSAIQQISKLKMKYSSLSSLQDIKKLSRNQMHGKPFVERFVPGVNFQSTASTVSTASQPHPHLLMVCP